MSKKFLKNFPPRNASSKSTFFFFRKKKAYSTVWFTLSSEPHNPITWEEKPHPIEETRSIQGFICLQTWPCVLGQLTYFIQVRYDTLKKKTFKGWVQKASLHLHFFFSFFFLKESLIPVNAHYHLSPREAEGKNKLVIRSQSGLHRKILPQKSDFLVKTEKLFRDYSKNHHYVLGDGKPKAFVHAPTSWQWLELSEKGTDGRALGRFQEPCIGFLMLPLPSDNKAVVY